MKLSQYFIPTRREDPGEAELVSHRLMVRAGMIRQVASGLYTWLPLGWRILQRVTAVVREEMNMCGALEIQMPMVQPAELWQSSDRWQAYGKELLRFHDRHDREFCLGPTHEEVVTDLVRQTVRSYKQLPMTLYQIQTKFRDEIRPRFGVMRAREFLMKDAYSFHLSMDDLNQTYLNIRQAYQKIFTRLGLNYRVVLADSGAIGGEVSEEFHVLAQSGEDELLYSAHSDYAANVEQAVLAAPDDSIDESNFLPLKTVSVHATDEPGLLTELKIKPEQHLRVQFVEGEETDWVAVVYRADHQLNGIKVARHPLVRSPLTILSDQAVQARYACSSLFAGVGSDALPVLLDYAASAAVNAVMGSGKAQQMSVNVNATRDLKATDITDLRCAKAGDQAADGSGELQVARGIEVGHIFQLGDKYSRLMQAQVLNDAGKSQDLFMGCYGIGVSRVVAACIEQNHDARGIVWPAALAPFAVIVIPLNAHKSYRVQAAAEQLYADLEAAGIAVLWDDRRERPGVKFSDADLIGIPHRLVISERGLEVNQIEYQARTSETAEQWPEADCVSRLQAILG